MINAISAISKYHITGEYSLTMSHPWPKEQKKPFGNKKFSKYCGTWGVTIILIFYREFG